MSLRSGALLLGAALLTSTAAVYADAKGDALVKAAKAKATAARSLQGDLQISSGGDSGFKGSIQLMKPNYLRLRITGMGNDQMLISNGKDAYEVSEGQKQYQQMPAPRNGAEAFGLGSMMSPIGIFFDPTSLAGSTKYAGTVKSGGKTYEVVQLTAKEDPKNRKLFIGPSGLVEGVELKMEQLGQTQTVTMWVRNLKVDGGLTAKSFAYTPPADFSVRKGPEDSLIAEGKAAPDFQLPQLGGGNAELSNLVKGKKAVLVNFWFYG